MWQDFVRKHEWGKSPAHLAFLTTFLKPRVAEQNPTDIDWQFVLGELPALAVERYIALGVIDKCRDKEELLKLKVEELRTALRVSELPVSGRKEKLVDRILQEQVAVLQCTARGQEIAEEYLKNPQELIDNKWTSSTLTVFLKWAVESIASEIAVGTVLSTLIVNAWNRLLEPNVLPAQPPPATPAPEPVPEPPSQTTSTSTPTPETVAVTEDPAALSSVLDRPLVKNNRSPRRLQNPDEVAHNTQLALMPQQSKTQTKNMDDIDKGLFKASQGWWIRMATAVIAGIVIFAILYWRPSQAETLPAPVEVIGAIDIGTSTSTLTPTRTPSPSHTLTPGATSISMISVTSTEIPDPVCVVNVSSTNLRAGPDTSFEIKRTVLPENTVHVLAQDEGTTWYLVELDSGEQGWLANSVCDLNAYGQAIPTPATVPATSTPTPTPTPTPTNTPSPTPTPGPIINFWTDGTNVYWETQNVSATYLGWYLCGADDFGDCDRETLVSNSGQSSSGASVYWLRVVLYDGSEQFSHTLCKSSGGIYVTCVP